MATTYNDKFGRPHLTEDEARLASYSTAHGQYTANDGRVFTTERELQEYYLKKERGLA